MDDVGRGAGQLLGDIEKAREHYRELLNPIEQSRRCAGSLIAAVLEIGHFLEIVELF